MVGDGFANRVLKTGRTDAGFNMWKMFSISKLLMFAVFKNDYA